MARSEADHPFGKDFGYLRPFLERLKSHAASMEGDSGRALEELIAQEATRWQEIEALLAGRTAQPAVEPSPEPSGRSDGSSRGTLDAFGLTVGNLRGLEPRRRADD